MNHYRLYGMHFTSDFTFLQLAPLESGETGEPVLFTIEEGVVPEEYKFERNCYSNIDTEISFLANRTCYLLVEKGKRITYERKAGADNHNLNAYLLGWGVAMLAFQRGMPAIHCSCVANEQGALLICGGSGSGKSTVTTGLLQNGYGLVADDMVLVDTNANGKSYALPAFPYQKLCRDAAEESGISLEEMVYIDERKDKFLVPYQGEFPDGPVPIHAMIILGWSEAAGIVVNEIEGVDKMHACINALFLKALFREQLYCVENGTACLRLASGIPIYSVKRSRQQDKVEKVLEAIKNLSRI